MKRTTKILATLLFFAISALIYSKSYQGNIILNEQRQITVTKIIDGDTIVIGGGERVRLLGIDAPEKGDFFYKESKQRLEQLIEKRNVILGKEGDNKDKYGRLLRYAFADDININLKMVEEGYAICYFYEKSIYQETCRKLEEKAQNEKIGIWQK